MKKVNDEVLVADEPLVRVDRGFAAELQRGAMSNPRRRMRLCAHATVEDPLHEMVIALSAGTYIRPHKHVGKSESMTSEELGGVGEVLRLGSYGSGKTFFVRMATPRYHMLLVRSDVLVVHETTNGPFNPQDTVFAPWSPDGADPEACGTFMARVERAISATPRPDGKDV